MSKGSQRDITQLPQTVRDFISRSGHSLNRLSWKASYPYPQEASQFQPVKQPLKFFILHDGHKLSFLTQHRDGLKGTVYEIGPRSVHGSTRPAAPRRERKIFEDDMGYKTYVLQRKDSWRKYVFRFNTLVSRKCSTDGIQWDSCYIN